MLQLFFLLLFASSTSSTSYHKTDVLLTRVKLMCATTPELTCEKKNDILVVNWNKHKQGDTTLLVFNEHAREKVTGELALHIIRNLRRWRPEGRITIIPCLNAYGRRQVDAGQTCVRKNKRGVDTNRNFQTSKNRHHYPKDSEEWEGKHPLSEKESQLVASLLLQGVKRYVNVHSGEFSIYMPYDSRVNVLPPNHKVMEKNIHRWSKMGCPQCAVGAAASTSFYRAYGTSVDFAIENDVPEAYTFEIYGDEQASCEKMFNPSPSKLGDILHQWSKIIHDVVTL